MAKKKRAAPGRKKAGGTSTSTGGLLAVGAGAALVAVLAWATLSPSGSDWAAGLLHPAPPADGVRPTQHKRLMKWDPIEIGHERRLRLDDTGRVYVMRTVSTKPPVFEIEDFMSEAETDHILKRAERAGLYKSDHTYLDGSNFEDKDQELGDLSRPEAHKLFRYSDQTWIDHHMDKTMDKIYARALTLAQVHPSVVNLEQLQVVKYKPWGHYECHYDTERAHNGPCCHDPFSLATGKETGVAALTRPLEDRCALCRYITILHYLVDTEEGGGTIFPLANLTDAQFDDWKADSSSDKYKQTQQCAPGLVVKPKRGKAILWYNHDVDDNGFLGDLDERTLHGGCDVVKGSKWIANHWISALPDPYNPRDPASSHT